MILEGILKSIIQVLAVSWWIIIPSALFFIFWDSYLYYIRRRYIYSFPWIILEIKIPRGIEKTPKAMEQVFAALHAPYSYGFTFLEKYWEGKTEQWFSIEFVGYAGGIYFYIRTPEEHRNLVESAIYSQYPDAEIHEADDYLDLLGTTIPNKSYDLWGTDFILTKDDGYPIRTYPAFEEKTEEALIDPVATISEVMSRLREGEMILIQMLIRPTGEDWKKKGEELRDRLLKREKPKAPGFFGDIGAFIRNLIFAPFYYPVWGETKSQEARIDALLLLSPGERAIIEGIERKISKLGFETTTRFIYIDNRESFTSAHVSAVFGAFRQFNTQDLNAFKPDKKVMTRIRYGPFKRRRLHFRKRILFDRYFLRRLSRRSPILNIEELATVFHPPSIAVEAPMLRHLPSKKGEPPPGLPVE